MARWVILGGLVLAAVGLILHDAAGLLNCFGKLPGDIRIESERGKLFFPITSMVIVNIWFNRSHKPL